VQKAPPDSSPVDEETMEGAINMDDVDAISSLSTR